MTKPRIAITLGDPAGIGPEITAAALRHPRVLSACVPIVVGDPLAFARHHQKQPAVERCVVPGLKKRFPLGRPTREAGRSAVRSLEQALSLLRSGEAKALVTAPVSKEVFHLAHYGFPGHTEWLAHEAGSAFVSMLMVAGDLRALLMTRHVPLSRVSASLSREIVIQSARQAQDFVKTQLRRARPRIVVCGINPHAGDNGLIGTDEKKILVPALRALKKRGMAMAGPVPADTVFKEMAQGHYDLALAAYHDQGMIPLKLHAPSRLVNITLGLPFVRTSPGHGTAYDIAGKGRADAGPMIEAILLAAKYAQA